MAPKQPTAESDSESVAGGDDSRVKTRKSGAKVQKNSRSDENTAPTIEATSVEDKFDRDNQEKSTDTSGENPVEALVGAEVNSEDDNNGATTSENANGACPIEGFELGILGQGGVQDLDIESHRTLMSSSLFEFYCNSKAADLLNAQPGCAGKYTRESDEAKELGRKMFIHNSQFFIAHGVLPTGVEEDGWEEWREEYRRILDHLGSVALGGVDLNVGEASRAVAQDDRAAGRIVYGEIYGLGNGESQTAPMRIPVDRRLPDHDERNKENMPPAPGTFKPGSPHRDEFPSFTPQTYIQQLGLCRYTVEFQEEIMLGKGGFGAVWRARHIMDGQVYAVKKIFLSEKMLKRLQVRTVDDILLEIRTLAKLEHPNIVRYYGAWAEYRGPLNTSRPNFPRSESTRALIHQNSDSGEEFVFDDAFEETVERAQEEDDIGDEHGEPSKSDEDDENDTDGNESDYNGGLDESDNGIVFEEPSGPVIESDQGINHEDDDDDDVETIPRDFDEDYTYSDDADMFTDGNHSAHLTANGKTVPITLFIQMSLHPVCLARYLRGSLDEIHRHCFHILPSLKIMLGILAGVDHIHSKKIIHRDLKPGNIFLSLPENHTDSKCPACEEKGVRSKAYTNPRIGDFGLVAEVIDPEKSTGAPITGSHTGTTFYRPYNIPSIDEALDVFALGVIFFELIYPLNTVSERAMVLMALSCTSDFRDGAPTTPRLPNDFERVLSDRGLKGCGLESAGEVANIVQMTTSCILGMVEPDAGKRWSIKEIRLVLQELLVLVEKDRF